MVFCNIVYRKVGKPYSISCRYRYTLFLNIILFREGNVEEVNFHTKILYWHSTERCCPCKWIAFMCVSLLHLFLKCVFFLWGINKLIKQPPSPHLFWQQAASFIMGINNIQKLQKDLIFALVSSPEIEYSLSALI